MDLRFCLKVNLFLFLSSLAIAEIEKECSETLTLRNGKVRLQLRGGVTAVFTCDAGFTLRGSNVSHCQTDGHWSAPSPTCVPHDQRCLATEIETLYLQPGQSINVSCSRDVSFEDSHIFWTTNFTRVNTTFINSETLVATTKSPGLYTCLMHTSSEVNILRTVNIVASDPLRFLPAPEDCNLSFKNTTSSITLVSGSNLSISCEVEHQSVGMLWLKDGKPILDERGAYFNSFLNISNVQKFNEGNYTCIVQSHLNQCSKVKSVFVKVEKLTQLTSNFACGQPVKSIRRWKRVVDKGGDQLGKSIRWKRVVDKGGDQLVKSIRRWKRVIDGSRAAPLSAPWMGMLSIENESPFCGCSLISDRWVVTAAHCFRNKGNFSFMSQEIIHQKVRVKFGKQQRRQIEKGEVVRNIQTLVIHPHYEIRTSSRNLANEHDIALVKLDEPITFQPSVLPVCLPPPGFMESVPTGALGVVTGWGRVSVKDSVMALTLQEAYLPLVNNSVCQKSTNYVITNNMLCAGYAESYRPDTCSGDSGGPYVIQKFNSWFLVGVVSWGEGCSNPKKFGIYTRVEQYVPWIQSIVLEKFTENM